MIAQGAMEHVIQNLLFTWVLSEREDPSRPTCRTIFDLTLLWINDGEKTT